MQYFLMESNWRQVSRSEYDNLSNDALNKAALDGSSTLFIATNNLGDVAELDDIVEGGIPDGVEVKVGVCPQESAASFSAKHEKAKEVVRIAKETCGKARETYSSLLGPSGSPFFEVMSEAANSPEAWGNDDNIIELCKEVAEASTGQVKERFSRFATAVADYRNTEKALFAAEDVLYQK